MATMMRHRFNVVESSFLAWGNTTYVGGPAHLISWQLLKLFVPVSSCQNELSATFNHYLIIVAVTKQVLPLFSHCSNNILFLSLISAKIMSRKFLISFNWSFLLQIWNKWFNIVIYCLLPLYLATKAICPLCIINPPLPLPGENRDGHQNSWY